MGDVMFSLCELELVDKFLLLDENFPIVKEAIEEILTDFVHHTISG